MGIYETLYAFLGAFGTYMGEPGTNPWSQGFPRTAPLPDGPELPSTVTVTSEHRKYPKAWGLPALREAIAAYYRQSYGVEITAENVMVFAGGRPAIVALLLFLEPDIEVRLASTEYTPYYDVLERLRRPYHLVPQRRGQRVPAPGLGLHGSARRAYPDAAQQPVQSDRGDPDQRGTQGAGGGEPGGRLGAPRR